MRLLAAVGLVLAAYLALTLQLIPTQPRGQSARP